MSTAIGAALWRARWVALVAAVVGGVLGFLLASAGPAEYSASSRVVMAESNAFDPLQLRPNDDPTRFLGTQAAVMVTETVLRAAAVDPDAEANAETLAATTDVTVDDGRDVLDVTARGPSPEVATARADAVVAAYRQQAAQSVAAQSAAATAATRDPTVLDTIATATAAYGDGVAVVQPATASAATSPSPLVPVLGGAALAALAGLGLHAWHGSRRTDLTRFSAVSRAPVLAALSTREPWVTPAEGAATPELRAVMAVEYAGDGRRGPVLFTGVGAEDATAPVVRALADVAASRGRRVAVVDARSLLYESARPEAPALAPGPSAAGSAAGDAGPPAAEPPGAAGAPGSVVHLRCGPAELQDGSDRCDLARLSAAYDLVFVDVGPWVWSPLTLAVAERAVAVIAVVDVDADPETLRPLAERLDEASCPLTGLVVTHARRGRGTRSARAAAAPSADGSASRPARRAGTAQRAG